MLAGVTGRRGSSLSIDSSAYPRSACLISDRRTVQAVFGTTRLPSLSLILDSAGQ